MAYTKPSWMTWEDKGGSLFGNKDANEALKKGIDPTLVAEAMKQSDKIAEAQGITGRSGHEGSGFTESGQKISSAANILSAYESAKSGVLDSSLGESGYTGGIDMNIFAHGAAAAGQSIGQIGQQITKQGDFNPTYANNAGTKLGQMQIAWAGAGAGQDAKDTAKADAAAANQWRIDEAAKTKKYYEDMIQAQKDAAAEAAEKQRIENLKVKNTTPSAVGLGHQQLGITAARSGAFRSGAASRGTAQLARTAKGTNVKTLNIA